MNKAFFPFFPERRTKHLFLVCVMLWFIESRLSTRYLPDPRRAGLEQAFQFSYVRTSVRSYVCTFVRPSLRSNFGPYTFIKGQRDNTGTKGQYRNKGTTKGQQRDNKGPKEQRNKGTKEQRNTEQRNKVTKEQRNRGTKEKWNTGTKKHGNTGTKDHGNKGTKEHRNKGTKEQRNKRPEQY